MDKLLTSKANFFSNVVFLKEVSGMATKMKQIEVKGVTVTSRPSILDQDKLKLWVRSGGRCAVCNKYLLDLTYGVSTGEMAHIVGWSKADKSPRGEADLDLSERNKVENLVLLCAEHHKIVDTQALLEEFTLERLIRHKFDHEQRIYHLTQMANDSETIVIRMFGGIRGAMIELSNEHARNIVFESERKYAMFANAFDRHGIEIDLSGGWILSLKYTTPLVMYCYFVK